MQALDLSRIQLFLADENYSEFDYSIFFFLNPTSSEDGNGWGFSFC